MNFAKINTFLLIAAILILAGIFYFVFINKKDTNAQSDLLLAIADKLRGVKEKEPASSEPEADSVDPTEEDWEMIYSISEKIYFHKPLSIYEKTFQKKFNKFIQEDLAFCKEFYPVVDALVNAKELNESQQEFYATNKDQVDTEVAHRTKAAEELAANAQDKGKDESFIPATGADIQGANPPLAIDERNKIILSLFEDGVPKTVKQLQTLFKDRTGHDYGKNSYRVFGSLEGKYLTPFKKGDKTYYCLPEWFDGRKLKEAFKKQIA